MGTVRGFPAAAIARGVLMVSFDHVWARKAEVEQEFETVRQWRERLDRLTGRDCGPAPEEQDLNLGTTCEPL